jgi:spore germination cell wall hydrolase CwlJ-like protein
MTPLMCLATAIFFEARDQSITGQEMVAEVVMNRVAHEKFPDTVCGVVYQPKAFSFTHDGLPDDMFQYDTYYDKKAMETALQIGQDYLHNNQSLGSASTHYHTTEVSPYWKDFFIVDGVVGDHIFYTCDGFC